MSSHTLALQGLQDGAEDSRGCHCPRVWLIQPRRADVTGSSRPSFHVLGGLGCSFCTLGGSMGAGSRTSRQASFPHGPYTLLSQPFQHPEYCHRGGEVTSPTSSRAGGHHLLRACCDLDAPGLLLS